VTTYPGAGRLLAPLHVGVGIQGGSQIIRHALCTGMAADRSCVGLQMDWRNALKPTCRDRILAAAEQDFPALLPMVVYMDQWYGHIHGRHSSLLLQGMGVVEK
jgi:hypothetical protein